MQKSFFLHTYIDSLAMNFVFFVECKPQEFGKKKLCLDLNVDDFQKIFCLFLCAFLTCKKSK